MYGCYDVNNIRTWRIICPLCHCPNSTLSVLVRPFTFAAHVLCIYLPLCLIYLIVKLASVHIFVLPFICCLLTSCRSMFKLVCLQVPTLFTVTCTSNDCLEVDLWTLCPIVDTPWVLTLNVNKSIKLINKYEIEYSVYET